MGGVRLRQHLIGNIRYPNLEHQDDFCQRWHGLHRVGHGWKPHIPWRRHVIPSGKMGEMGRIRPNPWPTNHFLHHNLPTMHRTCMKPWPFDWKLYCASFSYHIYGGNTPLNATLCGKYGIQSGFHPTFNRRSGMEDDASDVNEHVHRVPDVGMHQANARFNHPMRPITQLARIRTTQSSAASHSKGVGGPLYISAYISGSPHDTRPAPGSLDGPKHGASWGNREMRVMMTHPGWKCWQPPLPLKIATFDPDPNQMQQNQRRQ